MFARMEDKEVQTIADNEFPFYSQEPVTKEEVKEPVLAEIPQGQGSTLNSDTVDSLEAVTAAVGGSNRLVATDSDGKLPTSIIPSQLTTMYESAQQTLTANTVVTLSHSLTSKPRSVWAVIVNTSTEHGYAVGDEVSFVSSNNAGSMSPGVYANATSVGFVLDEVVGIVSNTAPPVTQNIDLSKWKLIIRAIQ